MNTRIVALGCALTAVACSGSETRPSETPANAMSYREGTATAASDPSSATQGRTRRASVANSREGMSHPVEATHSSPASGPIRDAPDPGGGAAVASNPGVADQSASADNTKINERDRHAALTPMDQGNSATETEITAAVRKAMMADKTLSFTAKNAKIITTGNRVTLRGPVTSEQERASIEAIAKQTAGVSEVDNQLEVKK